MEDSNVSLPKPNLDDKRFFQIAEEARALIPTRAPEWTDHNVHDPGITFIELFSWLVEMQHYRLNRVSDESFRKFFGLVGLTPRPRSPAEVTISFDFPRDKALFVPAGARVVPTSIEDLPFETLDDFFLTAVQLVEVITRAGDREIRQTSAEDNIAGHYEAFGPNPTIGNSLSLAFDKWFTDEEEIRLSISLFEEDLRHRIPLPAGEPGFVPSANLNWEFYSQAGWVTLELIGDSTLHLSRSGDLIFRGTNAAGKLDNLYWIRATLTGGSYEIPPRIAAIRTNSIRARQVETIVNEPLGMGLNTPDQTVRLKKSPVLVDSGHSSGRFLAGEVLDWQALVFRLAIIARGRPTTEKPDKFVPPAQAAAVFGVADKLGEEAKQILRDSRFTDPGQAKFAELHEKAQYRYPLAQSFNQLLENSYLDTGRPDDCLKTDQLRQFNRLRLQRVFPDLLLSDRVEIQTGRPVSKVEDEAMSWVSWMRVVDFSGSGPKDLHYVLDPETGVIHFGNGLNGRVPQITEHIRARFYRHTRADAGNVTAGLKWSLSLPLGSKCPGGSPEPRVTGTNFGPGEGGALAETIEEAKFRSRQVFRTPQRVLTAEDYESQTLGTPGLRVARAKTMPNHHPDLPKIPYPGDVTVVVVPAARGAIQPGVEPPSPSQGFRDTVRNFLNSRRIVATNIHVIGPKWIPVRVSARVFLRKGASTERARQNLEQALNEFLNPYTGGPQHGKGWPFGRAVVPSEIYQLLAKAPDVEYATDVGLNGNATEQPFRLPSTGLPYPGAHNLDIVPFELRNQTAPVSKSRGKGGHCHA